MGARVWSLELKVQGLGFRVWGLGFTWTLDILPFLGEDACIKCSTENQKGNPGSR